MVNRVKEVILYHLFCLFFVSFLSIFYLLASQAYYSITEVRGETWNLGILFSKKNFKKDKPQNLRGEPEIMGLKYLEDYIKILKLKKSKPNEN
jgi:hypothetical protein